MSGVVSPVVTCSSAVVTPSVPMLADGWPAIRQSWRISSTVEVLPLVPVTATIVSGKGCEEFARRAGRRPAAARRRRYGPRPRPAPRAARPPRPRPSDTASGMKSSPLKRAPRNAPNTVPGATLRWSMAKPVTGAVSPLPVSAPSFISAPRSARATGGIRSDVSMSRLVSGMTPSSGPVRWITRADDGRGGPGGGGDAGSWRRLAGERRASTSTT